MGKLAFFVFDVLLAAVERTFRVIFVKKGDTLFD